jgi:AraC family transcriptional regulator
LELAVFYDRLAATTWTEGSHSHTKIMLLFEPASCGLTVGVPGGEEKTRRLSGGQVCIIGSHLPHTVEWEKEASFAAIYIAPSFLRRIADNGELKGLHIQELAALNGRDHIASLIITIFRSLCEEREERDHEFVIAIARGLAARILKLVFEALRGGESRNDCLSRSQRSVVIEYMDSRIDQRIPTADLAKLVGLSSSQFMRTFRNTTGAAAGQFHLMRRLHRAEEILLRTDTTLAEVANHLGFFDQNHFTRHFRKHLGYSPGALARLRKKPHLNGCL